MRKSLLVIFIFFLTGLGLLFAQERTISGRITSVDDGTPIPGVNIVVAGTSVGAIS
jgi:hypothetical protein